MITGKDVHREWRDGMLAQGREVPPRRMEWNTLPDEDRLLDERIADALNRRAPDPARDKLAERVRVLEEALRWAMGHVENVFALASRGERELPDLQQARAALSESSKKMEQRNPEDAFWAGVMAATDSAELSKERHIELVNAFYEWTRRAALEQEEK